jgi:hypothetical protein
MTKASDLSMRGNQQQQSRSSGSGGCGATAAAAGTGTGIGSALAPEGVMESEHLSELPRVLKCYSLAEAVAAARDGDVVKLLPGVHVVSQVILPSPKPIPSL